jgi:hypothetical protein
MIGRQRARLVELRRSSDIGDHTFQVIEEELDWAEGNANRQMRSAAGRSQ